MMIRHTGLIHGVGITDACRARCLSLLFSNKELIYCPVCDEVIRVFEVEK